MTDAAIALDSFYFCDVCGARNFNIGPGECEDGHFATVVSVCCACRTHRCLDCTLGRPISGLNIRPVDIVPLDDIPPPPLSPPPPRPAKRARTSDDECDAKAKKATMECAVCVRQIDKHNLRKHWITQRHSNACKASVLAKKYCGLKCVQRKHRGAWVTLAEQLEMRQEVATTVVGGEPCDVCGGFIEME